MSITPTQFYQKSTTYLCAEDHHKKNPLLRSNFAPILEAISAFSITRKENEIAKKPQQNVLVEQTYIRK